MAELGGDAPAGLTFDFSEDHDGCPLVRLRGELDMSNVGRLESAAAPLIAKSPKRLVVDASELEFADSSAIALLVRWANVIDAVEIRHPPALLRRVIARMGLSQRLQVSP